MCYCVQHDDPKGGSRGVGTCKDLLESLTEELISREAMTNKGGKYVGAGVSMPEKSILNMLSGRAVLDY